jgi:ribonuclease HII
MEPLLLFAPENPLAAEGWIAGVDEAGRGPLAGPVVAAAVVLPPEPRLLRQLQGLTDSKAMSPAARAAMVPRIQQVALAYGVGIATAPVIDGINILQATFLAMRRAVACLERSAGRSCDGLLIDGNHRIPGLAHAQWPIIKGDAKHLAIAAASVLAKELRDALMVALDGHYPGYGFAQHKGYPTATHRDAIQRLGPCPQHRRSFGGVREFTATR